MLSSLHRFLPSCLLILCSTISALLSAAPQREPACSGPVSGQTAQLTGQVLDSTGAALPGVAVTLLCGSTQHQVTTGAEGRFTLLAAPGSYQLRIRKPEFASASLPISMAPGAAANQDVTLQPAGVSDAITVTAGGFEQIVREAPASVTVIQRADLQTRRVADLAQALIDVEGVDVGQNVGKTGGLTISMRGMPSDYTLMLIDGRRQNAPGSVTPNGFGETATSFMPPVGAIERIEVVRGPMSTLCGSDAMGGVVNVITRKVSERWTGTVSADGTFQTNRDFGDTRQGNFYLSGPLWSDRLGLAVRGNAFRRDAAALQYETVNGQQVPITSFGLSPTRSDIYNLGGRLSYVINDCHDIYADFDNLAQSYDNSSRQLGTVGVQGGYAEDMKFRRQQFALSHSGRTSWGLFDSSFTRNVTDTNGRTVPPRHPRPHRRRPAHPRSHQLPPRFETRLHPWLPPRPIGRRSMVGR